MARKHLEVKHFRYCLVPRKLPGHFWTTSFSVRHLNLTCGNLDAWCKVSHLIHFEFSDLPPLSVHESCRYRLLTGRSYLERLVPWCGSVGPREVFHLISSINDGVIADLIEDVGEEYRPLLQRTMARSPKHRWTIDRLVVRC